MQSVAVYKDFLGMTDRTSAGYKEYAAELGSIMSRATGNISGRRGAPRIALAGEAFKHIYHLSDEPLSNTSMFT